MKEFMIWRDDWLTVLEAVNDQHREIARNINSLAATYLDEVDCTAENVKLEQVQTHIDHLYQVTRQHFCYEEKLMEDVGYGERDAHAREHQIMLAELKHYTKRIGENPAAVDLSLLMALKRWFENHVLMSDQEFTDFAASRKHPHRQELPRAGRI